MGQSSSVLLKVVAAFQRCSLMEFFYIVIPNACELCNLLFMITLCVSVVFPYRRCSIGKVRVSKQPINAMATNSDHVFPGLADHSIKMWHINAGYHRQ